MIEFLEKFTSALAKKVQDGLIEKGFVALSKNEEPSVKLYSAEDVCKRLSVSKQTLYRHRKLGLITPSGYVGRSPRFSDADIASYLTKFRVAI